MREAATAVEAVHGRGAVRRATGTTTARTPSSPLVPGLARDDDELVDRVAFDHEALLAVQDRAVAVERNGRRRRRPGSNEPPRFGDRERAAQLAGRDRAEEARPLLGGRGLAHGGDVLRDGRQERTGRDHAAELLGEDAGFDHAEADAAVGFGRR